jgi:hypothetical protein
MVRSASLLGLVALVLVGCASGGEGDDGGSADPAEPAGSALVVDAGEFCDRLSELPASDPFEMIFGNENPMDAAATFDNGEHQLDELAALAPESAAASAERYRQAFAGFRLLVLPPDTIDEATYRDSFDDLRAEQQAARAELDRHLAEECSG